MSLIGIVTVIGYLLLLGIKVTSTQADVTWHMIVPGLGLGPAPPIFLLAVQNAVDPREMGAATSSSQFFRQIGSTIGVAVFGTILSTTLTARLETYLPAQVTQALRQAFTDAILRVFLWGLVFVILGLVVTVFLPEVELRRRDTPAAAVRSEL